MEKKFIKFLVISFILHIIIISALFSYFSKTKLNMEFKEKSVNVAISKIEKREIRKLYKKKKSRIGEVKSIEGYKGSITEKNIDQTIDWFVEDNKFSYKKVEIESKKFKKDKKDLLKDENLLKYTKKDLESLNTNEAFYFTDGKKRKLVIGYIEELKSLNIESNVKFKTKLEIDKNGEVLSIDIIESSGDIKKDKYIIDIIKKWKFEESDIINQIVIVELKYLLE